MRARHVAASLEAGTGKQPVHPLFDVGELIDLRETAVLCIATLVSSHLSLESITIKRPLMKGFSVLLTVCSDPGPDCYVGNGKMIADKVAGRIRSECRVHGAVDAAGFVDVALQSVWVVTWSRDCYDVVKVS